MNIPPLGSDPQGDAARLEAESLVRQLGAMSPELKQRFVEDFATAFWTALRGYALPDAKNFVNMRFLHSGSEVTQTSGGTVVGLTGGKGQFDIVNFVGGTADIDSASNARQLNVHVGGGGADCMFDYLVSSCFSSLAGFTEGQTFTALSGCTFKGYSTVAGAAAAISALANQSAMVLFICSGDYVENVNFTGPATGGKIAIFGAGRQHTRITGATSGGTALNIGSISQVTMQNIKVGSNASASAVGLSCGGNTDTYIFDCEFVANHASATAVVASAGTRGVRFATCDFTGTGTGISGSGIYFANCDIAATTGITCTASGPLGAVGCLFTGTTGVKAATSGQTLRTSVTESVFSGCTTGVSCTAGPSFAQGEIIGNTFLNCATAIHFGTTANNANSMRIIGNHFTSGNAAHKGIDDTSGALSRSVIIGNTFWVLNSGNELIGLDTSDNTIGHNVTDSGATLPDTHTTAGSGSSAPSAEPFVTIGNSSNLSAERALTAGNGVGFTDGGANTTVTLNLVDLTGNWTQAGVFDISTAGNLTVLKHLAVGAGQSIDANSVAVIGESVADPAAAQNAVKGTLTTSMTADNAQAITGLNYQLSFSGAHTLSGIAAAVKSTLNPAGGATVTDSRNFWALAVCSATLTNRYGLYVQNGSGAGAITNQYGVYIESMTKGGTLNYGIYQAGAQNFLGGEIIAGPVTAPATPAATNLVVYNESGTQFLKTKDASGNVYNMTHKHVFAGVVDASTASTTVPFAVIGPMPHAGTITDVRALPTENKTGGATSGIFDVHQIAAASVNTDGQGTTIFTTQANRPTISSGNKLSTTTAPDVTSLGAGDYLALYTDQVGTNLTFVSISVTVRYT